MPCGTLFRLLLRSNITKMSREQRIFFLAIALWAPALTLYPFGDHISGDGKRFICTFAQRTPTDFFFLSMTYQHEGCFFFTGWQPADSCSQAETWSWWGTNSFVAFILLCSLSVWTQLHEMFASIPYLGVFFGRIINRGSRNGNERHPLGR